MKCYDVIVVGVGGVGSAALYHLARRGVRAVGIDRFAPPHDRGSTHGHTRVIRQAYYEHPDYVPLLRESYHEWFGLESHVGRKLFHQIGLLEVGPADGVVVPNVLSAARQYDIPVESLNASDIEKRWPGLRVDSDCAGVFEPGAGYLLVEDCVQAHLDAARAAGAELLANTEVVHWRSGDGGIIAVRTSDGTEIEAESMIFAAGPWAAKELGKLGVPCEVRRKSLFWFACDKSEYSSGSGLPVYLFELPNGIFYGFPKLDEHGVKFAEHSGGRTVEDQLTVDRTIDADEERRLVEALAQLLPGVSPRVTQHAVCMYTMSPDEHFILDRHPAAANVVFAAGLSGHGFKFVPVLGRALADLALDGGTDLPIDFLSLKRFGRAAKAV
jgi:monomeric sarcosine oxidase